METSSVTAENPSDEAFGLDGGGGGSFSSIGTAAANGTSAALVLRLVPQLGQKLDPLGMESDPQALHTREVSVMLELIDVMMDSQSE